MDEANHDLMNPAALYDKLMSSTQPVRFVYFDWFWSGSCELFQVANGKNWNLLLITFE